MKQMHLFLKLTLLSPAGANHLRRCRPVRIGTDRDHLHDHVDANGVNCAQDRAEADHVDRPDGPGGLPTAKERATAKPPAIRRVWNVGAARSPSYLIPKRRGANGATRRQAAQVRRLAWRWFEVDSAAGRRGGKTGVRGSAVREGWKISGRESY